MQLDGLDISENLTNSVDEYLNSNIQFDYVVTVCDDTAAEKCPYFPGKVKRLHWSFQDPSSLKGSNEDKLQKTVEIRDRIKERVLRFIESNF